MRRNIKTVSVRLEQPHLDQLELLRRKLGEELKLSLTASDVLRVLIQRARLKDLN